MTIGIDQITIARSNSVEGLLVELHETGNAGIILEPRFRGSDMPAHYALDFNLTVDRCIVKGYIESRASPDLGIPRLLIGEAVSLFQEVADLARFEVLHFVVLNQRAYERLTETFQSHGYFLYTKEPMLEISGNQSYLMDRRFNPSCSASCIS